MKLKYTVLILSILYIYIPSIHSFGTKKEISKIDAELFLEDDEGSGDGDGEEAWHDDNESPVKIFRQGVGFDDEDIVNTTEPIPIHKDKPNLVPKLESESTSGRGHGHKNQNDIVDQEPDESGTTNFILQPAVIGGIIVGVIGAILVLSFIVYRYRRRRKPTGDYQQVVKEGPYSAKCEEAYA